MPLIEIGRPIHIYQGLKPNPKKPGEVYPTPYSERKYTRQDLWNFQKRLLSDLHSDEMLNHAKQLEHLKDMYSQCDDDVKYLGLKICSLLEEIYPVSDRRENKRDDGTFKRVHFTWCAETVAEAAMGGDVVAMTLLHDALEEHRLAKNRDPGLELKEARKRLWNHCGPQNERQEAFLESVWWMMTRMTYVPLPEQNGRRPEKMLKEALSKDSWGAFQNLEMRDLLQPIKQNHNKGYVHIQIHQSDSLELIVGKLADSTYNNRSAKYLTNVDRRYSHLRKGPIHSAAGLQTAWLFGDAIREGLREQWEQLGLEGIGAQHIPVSYSEYANLYIKSLEQIRYENEGYNLTNPRYQFDEKRCLTRTVPRIFAGTDGMSFIGTENQREPLSVEVPTIIGPDKSLKAGKDGPMIELEIGRLKDSMNYNFDASNIGIEYKASMLGPLLGQEFLIAEVVRPERMLEYNEEITRLQSDSRTQAREVAAHRVEHINEDYLNLVSAVQDIMRKIYQENIMGQRRKRINEMDRAHRLSEPPTV